MRRGEVYWVSFDSSVGGEVKKARPAVVISNDASNKALSRFQVVPISSRVAKLYPCESLVTLRGQPCKAMADQIMTVSRLHIRDYVGQLTSKEMAGVERAVKLQLGLEA